MNAAGTPPTQQQLDLVPAALSGTRHLQRTETTMAIRTNDGTLLGYSAAIADAIRAEDDALLDLVEEFMRGRTGGTLDALTASEFDRLAHASLADLMLWAATGIVDGMTLHNYCRILGLSYPPTLLVPPSD